MGETESTGVTSAKVAELGLRAAIVAGEAVSELMALNYPDLPRLAWKVDASGHLTGQVEWTETDDEIRAALAAWAAEFGLVETEAVPGLGMFDGPVTVWGVVNREVWERGGRRG